MLSLTSQSTLLGRLMGRREFLAALQVPVFLGLGGCGGSAAPGDPSATRATGFQAAMEIHFPDEAAITYSDCFSVEASQAAARFSRPVSDAWGLQSVNPGARIRFMTDSPEVTIRLQYTDLMLAPNLYQGTGCLLVDGSLYSTFGDNSGFVGPLSVELSFSDRRSRVIEIVMPYSASVDLQSISVEARSSFAAAPARPALRCGFFGDSITQGFSSTQIDRTWPYRLAMARGWQMINGGYAGYPCLPENGATFAQTTVDVATFMIGFNDYNVQTSLPRFRAKYIGWLNRYRSVAPDIKVYCITPTYSPYIHSAGDAISLEDYRDAIRNAVSTLNQPLNILIEGLELCDADPGLFPDQVHPGDAAAQQVAERLAERMVI